MNDSNERGYGGPMPPKGHGSHHCFFNLYALDQALNLGGGSRQRAPLGKHERSRAGGSRSRGSQRETNSAVENGRREASIAQASA
ncbi:hypothetical protein HQ520_07275 [bacterium]|nr:hypothetical protein [bacterium]